MSLTTTEVEPKIESRPEFHSRLVRNCDVDQGRPMKNVTKVMSFLFANRRVIGTVVGGMLVLFGYNEEGAFVTRLGEQ